MIKNASDMRDVIKEVGYDKRSWRKIMRNYIVRDKSLSRTFLSKTTLLLLGGFVFAHVVVDLAFGAYKDIQWEKANAAGYLPGSQRVGECFFNKLEEIRSDIKAENKNTMRTEVFLFDAITQRAKQIGQARGDQSKLDLICNEIYGIYKPRYLSAKILRDQKEPGKLAPSGDLDIETDTPFLDTINNMTNKESWGHSNITEIAFKEANSGTLPTQNATFLIQQASQSADLYFWETEAYHAHTPEPTSFSPPEVERSIQIGKCEFKKIVYGRMQDIWYQTHGSIDQYHHVLLHLGLALHAIQDLVYHRGMTLAEHSALQFVFDKSPDYPEGEAAEDRKKEVVEFSKQLILRTKEFIGEDIWKRIITWKMQGSQPYPKVIGKQDLGYWSLFKYWSLHSEYVPNASKYGRLTWDEQSKKVKGVIEWDVVALMQEILEQISLSSKGKTNAVPFTHVLQQACN